VDVYTILLASFSFSFSSLSSPQPQSSTRRFRPPYFENSRMEEELLAVEAYSDEIRLEPTFSHSAPQTRSPFPFAPGLGLSNPELTTNMSLSSGSVPFLSSSPLLLFFPLSSFANPFRASRSFAMSHHPHPSSSFSMPPPPPPIDISHSAMRERVDALRNLNHHPNSKISEWIVEELDNTGERGWTYMAKQTDEHGVLWTRKVSQALINLEHEVRPRSIPQNL